MVSFSDTGIDMVKLPSSLAAHERRIKSKLFRTCGMVYPSTVEETCERFFFFSGLVVFVRVFTGMDLVYRKKVCFHVVNESTTLLLKIPGGRIRFTCMRASSTDFVGLSFKNKAAKMRRVRFKPWVQWTIIVVGQRR